MVRSSDDGLARVVLRKLVADGHFWHSNLASSVRKSFPALSIYLVMQTMEAVIFRCLLLSVPMWLVWKWATLEPRPLRTPALARRRMFLEEDPESDARVVREISTKVR